MALRVKPSQAMGDLSDIVLCDLEAALEISHQEVGGERIQQHMKAAKLSSRCASGFPLPTKYSGLAAFAY